MVNVDYTPTVLITDHAWPDIKIEHEILESAGFRLVAGPASPASEKEIEKLVQEHQPDAILFCWAPVSSQAISASPRLKIAARMGIGLDNIDIEACTMRGIWVTNVPDYCIEEVSDHAVAMLLAWARGLIDCKHSIHEGIWDPSSIHLRRVSSLTCGIIGYGRIGRRTASKLSGFNIKLLANDPNPNNDNDIVQFCDLNTLLSRSDVIIIHAPLNSDTYHLINKKTIKQIKPGSFLINVSRGGIVNTDAVLEALESGHLSGAGLDVLESEPEVPLLLRNSLKTIITPHVAFSSDLSLIQLRRRATEEVVRVLRGESPMHPYNNPRSVSY